MNSNNVYMRCGATRGMRYWNRYEMQKKDMRSLLRFQTPHAIGTLKVTLYKGEKRAANTFIAIPAKADTERKEVPARHVLSQWSCDSLAHRSESPTTGSSFPSRHSFSHFLPPLRLRHLLSKFSFIPRIHTTFTLP